MIITGSLDELTNLKNITMATLSTNEIYCENVANGYNSSVMLFRTDKCDHIYTTLVKYYDHLLKYLMRFDHYLEMMVWNAIIF